MARSSIGPTSLISGTLGQPTPKSAQRTHITPKMPWQLFSSSRRFLFCCQLVSLAKSNGQQSSRLGMARRQFFLAFCTHCICDNEWHESALLCDDDTHAQLAPACGTQFWLRYISGKAHQALATCLYQFEPPTDPALRPD